MDITIQGLNLRLDEAVESYARRKLDRLDRYLPGISDVRLDLSHQNTRRGDLSTAQITVRHQRGAILRAEEKVNGDFESAINLALDKMHRQIERFKGKRTNHKGHERFSATLEELSAAEDIPELEAVDVLDETPMDTPPIVRRKDVPLSVMSEDEAIEQMELLGHSFFMFYNAGTGSVNVLYKRDVGDYGVLIPNLE